MIQLSKSLRAKLTLPNDWNPKLISAGGVITLGPIIGILAARPFDRQTTYFHHLFRLAKEKQMFVYVFEPKDINWDQKVIKGTTLDGEGIFPFPAVIYDRFLFRGKTNITYDIDEVRVKLQTLYKIPFLNPPSLFQLTGNKWETHQLLLDKHEEYLPETRLIEHSTDLTEMLDRYGEVYIKPVLGGSMSKGVIRIIRRPTAILMFHLNTKALQQFSREDELFEVISPLIERTPHLIQEGIRRKKYNGKNLEVRVYMQKNEKQTWFRTGMVTRLTGEEVMTGDLEENLRLSKVMNSLYLDATERRYMTNQLGKVAKKIVTTVEQEIGNFGELAVDLCIDQYDSIKLLEINAKPDNLFSQIRAYKLRSLAGIRLLNYAASLAGYRDQ
jgi:glutathione synthase/RimK-type ligase-like ATP-grasp enzyme